VIGKRMPRWPLFVIAAPAAVAVWSGWVGLGQLCGFGVIHPLPGIWDAARLNTAITLPVGVEAYAAYALAAWLTPGASQRARRFAKWSAIGALLLGMLGQVAYHLLTADHAARAPWPVVMLVACLPVAVMGMGTGLAHLLHEPGDSVPVAVTTAVPETTVETVAHSVPVDVPTAAVNTPAGTQGSEVHPVPAPSVRTVAARAPKRAPASKPKSLDRIFAAEIERGELPSLRQIKARARCGTDRARVVRDEIAAILQEMPQAA
jgi:hypothetical protein